MFKSSSSVRWLAVAAGGFGLLNLVGCAAESEGSDPEDESIQSNEEALMVQTAYRYKNVATGQCLARSNGALVMAPCGQAIAQRWNKVWVTDEYVYLKGTMATKCLRAAAGGLGNAVFGACNQDGLDLIEYSLGRYPEAIVHPEGGNNTCLRDPGTGIPKFVWCASPLPAKDRWMKIK